jgi:hypothetical protein
MAKEDVFAATGEYGSVLDPDLERSIRERAYFIWEKAGRPDGCALEHWATAARIHFHDDEEVEHVFEEEKLLAGRPDVDLPALLTKDAKGG